MKELREKNNNIPQLESEGWGLSRKILFVVFVIIVLFSAILSVAVGMKSSRHWQKQSRKNLVNMTRIFSDNLEALIKDLERTADLMIKDQKMKWRVRGLAELGPYYYFDEKMVGEHRMDSEMALFLAAQLHLVRDLRSFLDPYPIDCISLYLVSPFDKLPSAPPVLAARVTSDTIHIGRFDTIGTVGENIYYTGKTKEFLDSFPDLFEVDAIFSKTNEDFYGQGGFNRDQQAPAFAILNSKPTSEKLHSEISTSGVFPLIRIWYPIYLQLSNPDNLDDEQTTVGWLMLESRIDKAFMEVMGSKLGVHTGVILKDGSLISKFGKTKQYTFYGDETYIDIDGVRSTFAQQSIGLASPVIKAGLKVITFSPVTEFAMMATEMYVQIFISACVFILISTVIVYLAVTHIIHRPLNYLKEGVEQLKKGKLDHRVEVESLDELGYLSRAFNEMSVELKEKSDDLTSTLMDLRLAESYVKNIIDSMPSILIGVDNEGQITQWNTQATKITGIASEQAQGSLISDIVPQMAIEVERIRHAIKKREPEIELRKIMDLKGESCVTDVAIYPLTANGVAGAVIRVDNVTERVRLQEMMIQSEKMLSVGALAAGMAHEINNPLAGILQNLQVVQNRFMADMVKNQRTAVECGTDMGVINTYLQKRDIHSMLDAVRESGIRASTIVENMLSFSRKSESKFEHHYMADLIDTTIDLAGSSYDLKKKYDFKKITIIKDYESGLPKIPCEKVKIQQVVLNILENGAQALSDIRRGNHEPRLYIRLFDEGNMICLEIEDNGSGMKKDVLRRIFEPFFTTKEVGHGTGLGLSVSYFIITENHHGTMNVESIEDVGTKFIIKLPHHQKT